jgi:hypothetical protein
MDRTAALLYLQAKFSALATDAKADSQAANNAYITAIDSALIMLGVKDDDLSTADVDTTKRLPYLALLDYYTLDQFITIYALRYDVKLGQGSVEATRSQAYKQLEALRADAADKAANYGYSPGGSGVDTFSMGRLNLDFLEPGCGTGGEFNGYY